MVCDVFDNMPLPAWKCHLWLCLCRSKVSWTHRDRQLYEVSAAGRTLLCGLIHTAHLSEIQIVLACVKCFLCFVMFMFRFIILLIYCMGSSFCIQLFCCYLSRFSSTLLIFYVWLTFPPSVCTAFYATWPGWPLVGRTWKAFRRRWVDSCALTPSTPLWKPRSQMGKKRARPTLKSPTRWQLRESETESPYATTVGLVRNRIKSYFLIEFV